MKQNLSFASFANLVIGLAITADVENRDKLQPDDTLLREGWRAVYELGEEVCYANVVRSLAIALDMSDKPDFMDGMDEAFVQMELEMFQRIADAAG